MPTVNIVVIGASAGGLQASSDILAELSAQLRATILAVVHTPPERTSRPAAKRKAVKRRR